MSRHLPARPNVEHLKKQAKDLLVDLQQLKPDTQLADALHALAREYGFESWPKLKAHVDSLSLAPSPFVGRWIADVSRSKRHPANLFRSATIHVAVSGDAVTFTSSSVDSGGKEERSQQTIHVGSNAPRSAGHAAKARWLSARVLEVDDWLDGALVGRATYEVSADGSTLTINSPEQSIVLMRLSDSTAER